LWLTELAVLVQVLSRGRSTHSRCTLCCYFHYRWGVKRIFSDSRLCVRHVYPGTSIASGWGTLTGRFRDVACHCTTELRIHLVRNRHHVGQQ